MHSLKTGHQPLTLHKYSVVVGNPLRPGNHLPGGGCSDPCSYRGVNLDSRHWYICLKCICVGWRVCGIILYAKIVHVWITPVYLPMGIQHQHVDPIPSRADCLLTEYHPDMFFGLLIGRLSSNSSWWTAENLEDRKSEHALCGSSGDGLGGKNQIWFHHENLRF